MKSSSAFIFVCYVSLAAALTSRIANHGEVAQEKEFPYQVSLKYAKRHFCGGSLISENHVLTAAHCVQDNVVDDDLLLEEVSVEVGMIRQDTGQTYKVKRISYHPDFKNKQYQNDVAVVHLAESVQTSDKVSVISLPNANSSLLPGSKVFVSGFGAEDIDESPSPVLKMIDAEIVSNKICQKDHIPRLVESNICAKKGKDYGTCEGDSGGPLVDETKTTLIGVVSGGGPDCKNGNSNVYMKVSSFIPYINSELKYNSENPGSAALNPAINLKKMK